jgi:hypothetical protein
MTENANVEINMNDLVVLRQIVDVSSRAGIFKAEDLSTVGAVFDKLNVIVEDFMAKQKEAQEAANEEIEEVAE